MGKRKTGNGDEDAPACACNKQQACQKQQVIITFKNMPNAKLAIKFRLDNPSHKNKPYVIILTASGTTPGFKVGNLQVPINIDLLTRIGLQHANTPLFSNFVGILDKDGLGTATLNAPPLPGSLGVNLDFVFLQDGKVWDFVSNPARVQFVK